MRAIVLGLFVSGCVAPPSITLRAEVVATELAGTAPRDLAVIYSPEQGDHQLDGLVTVGEFPSEIALHAVGVPRGAFEEYGGVDGGACNVFFANAGTFGDADDGFGTDGSIKLAGYTLVYLTDPPKSPVFGLTNLDEGWNVLRSIAPTCADAEDLGGGALGFRAKYESVPLDATLRIVITGPLERQSWDEPFSCP